MGQPYTGATGKGRLHNFTSPTKPAEKHLTLYGLKFSDDAIRVAASVPSDTSLRAVGTENMGIINVFSIVVSPLVMGIIEHFDNRNITIETSKQSNESPAEANRR